MFDEFWDFSDVYFLLNNSSIYWGALAPQTPQGPTLRIVSDRGPTLRNCSDRGPTLRNLSDRGATLRIFQIGSQLYGFVQGGYPQPGTRRPEGGVNTAP